VEEGIFKNPGEHEPVTCTKQSQNKNVILPYLAGFCILRPGNRSIFLAGQKNLPASWQVRLPEVTEIRSVFWQ
jgi:hypothetical protein